ncbi:ATP-binding cassette domain-containing protein [Chryseobacterium sp. MYb264]|uniref:ATP-binding cassette domain-containing protein n=1 Tax=Chryseobacterium sp. MYb264 TaxID=2745153 RepID=UPI002E133E97|nr:ATP-binding cassette domain-containing protein [Chryseobacterium sp. MYb264]
MIEFQSVTKTFNEKTAVDNISFTANEKEILVLLGKSGCGKTTTLKMANRLIESDSGMIKINGENIENQNPEKLRMNIGFVMQNSGLFPHYTIAQNIAVVPQLLKWEKKKTETKTLELLEKLHLPVDILKRYPSELSGGQQQRVGIARALIGNSPILLLDEPFGALDNITKADIHSEFKSLDELKNKTILLVTHDVQEAFELGHRICLMDQGKIVQVGTPTEILYRPVNEFAESFFDENRLLLEYKVATLQDIRTFLSSEINDRILLDNKMNIWSVLQRIISEYKDNEAYESVVSAFTEYRKLHIA